MKLFSHWSKLGLLLICITALSSCASKKDIVFFQDEQLKTISLQPYIATLQPNDLLIINVSALDMQSVLPFNLPTAGSNGNSGAVTGQQKQQDYMIGLDGTITFPVLGTIALAGKTKVAAVALLQEKLKDYVKDPMVTIRIVNYTISVLGEVNSPGVFSIANERVSMLEAIGLAGDLTIHGQRKNVLLIRETAGEKHFTRLDLTATDFMSSKQFYLQQNDVLYVSPNKAMVNASAAGPSTSVWLSITSVIITIIALIIR
ncbi:MAG: polysaccharide biosynthesis/export family protein [Labilibaculum sp.]|nr:polysaccharide biosynthesis/export family protein [Labilibaculum sp.]